MVIMTYKLPENLAQIAYNELACADGCWVACECCYHQIAKALIDLAETGRFYPVACVSCGDQHPGGFPCHECLETVKADLNSGVYFQNDDLHSGERGILL